MVIGGACAAADPTSRAKASLLASAKDGVNIVVASFVSNKRCDGTSDLQRADHGYLYQSKHFYQGLNNRYPTKVSAQAKAPAEYRSSLQPCGPCVCRSAFGHHNMENPTPKALSAVDRIDKTHVLAGHAAGKVLRPDSNMILVPSSESRKGEILAYTRLLAILR
jgi:hypothetical protein